MRVGARCSIFSHARLIGLLFAWRRLSKQNHWPDPEQHKHIFCVFILHVSRGGLWWIAYIGGKFRALALRSWSHHKIELNIVLKWWKTFTRSAQNVYGFVFGNKYLCWIYSEVFGGFQCTVVKVYHHHQLKVEKLTSIIGSLLRKPHAKPNGTKQLHAFYICSQHCAHVRCWCAMRVNSPNTCKNMLMAVTIFECVAILYTLPARAQGTPCSVQFRCVCVCAIYTCANGCAVSWNSNRL